MPKTMTRFESEATLYEAKMTWTVGRIREMIKRKERLDSPPFSCKNDPNKAVWSLQLDFGNLLDDHLSFSCTNHSLTRDIFVDTLSFKIASKSASEIEGSCVHTDVTFGGTNSDRSSKQFPTTAKLNDLAAMTEKSKPHKDGNIHVTCKIKYFGSVKTFQKSGPISMPATLPRNPSLANSSRISREEILSSLAYDFDALSTSASTADISIVVGETKIPAHRCILMARSPVFKELLAYATFSPSREDSASASPSPQFELQIEQRNPRLVDALIKFLYSGKIPFDLDKMAKELMILAEYYGVKTLKSVCSEWLMKELCLKNAIDSLITAHLHRCPALKVASLELVVKHAAKFMAQDDWAAFASNHPELLNEVCLSLATKKK